MTGQDRDRERGLTLLELVIGMGIASVVAILAAYMLINTFTAQGSVTSSTAASTRGQYLGQLVDSAVRTAAAVHVSSDGTQLDVERPDGTCVSFRASSSKLEYRTFTLLTKLLAPWTNLSSFAPVSFRVDPVGSPSPAPYFATPSPPAVNYGFRLSDTRGSATVVSIVAPRNATRSTSTCF